MKEISKLLPVDQAEEKANKLLQEKVSAHQNTNETVSDDLPIKPEKVKFIQETEKVVRETLAIFGIDYDALIRMDANSLYAKVVKRKPEVLEHVMADENPVLAALKIAVGFQPYAEFIEKYGEEPEAIKNAIKEELMLEMKQKRTEKEKSAMGGMHERSPSFSNMKGVQKNKKSTKKENAYKQKSIEEMFKR